MTEATGEWFVSREGQRFGPVTFDTLVESAKAGRLEPRTDLVIGGPLPDWKPAGEVEGLFEKPDPEAMTESSVDGFAPPRNSMADSGSYDFEERKDVRYPGFGRAAFFFGSLLLPALAAGVVAFMIRVVGPSVGEKVAGYLPVLFLLAPILAIMIMVKRFNNMGMSGVWWLGTLVPILNLWLGYRLFACPPGYLVTRKLDKLGVVLAVLYWGVNLAWVGLFVAAMTGAFGEVFDSDEMKEQMEQLRRQLPKVPQS